MFGVRGIEKSSKVMMPGLFALLLVIILRSLTLPNAGEGLAFIFTPNQDGFTFGSISAALGQVFYSLSLCMGITITYGRYLSKEGNIPKSCLTVAGLDTMMAVLAGLAIFPAVFSFGLAPDNGPSLIFNTLPKVFEQLQGGALFAVLFFLLVFFAAVTSALALLEVCVSFAIDKWGWGRRKATLLVAGAAFLLGVPSALSYGVLSDLSILNYNLFDFVGMITGQPAAAGGRGADVLVCGLEMEASAAGGGDGGRRGAVPAEKGLAVLHPVYHPHPGGNCNPDGICERIPAYYRPGLRKRRLGAL